MNLCNPGANSRQAVLSTSLACANSSPYNVNVLPLIFFLNFNLKLFLKPGKPLHSIKASELAGSPVAALCSLLKSYHDVLG